jgi:hypothetical protein
MRVRVVETSLALGCIALFIIGGEMFLLRRRLDAADLPVASLIRADRSSPRHVPQILFVFRPADCPAALAIIDRWNAEHRSGRALVTGIVVTSTRDSTAVRAVVQSYRVEFPVRIADIDELAPTLRRLGISSIPVTLVFGETGSLRGVAPSTATTQDTTIERLVRTSLR